MALPSAAVLLGAWEPRSGRPPHQRLSALLAHSSTAPDCERDTLGERNRRLLALHAELSSRSMEARVVCAACQTENEFAVPVESILSLEPPRADATVSLRRASGVVHYRLPCMADLGASGEARAVLALCCLATPPPQLTDAEVLELGRRFEELDPAAEVVITAHCAGCQAPLRASVDVAAFVAADLDRFVDGVYADVDRIARAYGWSEQAILALPAARRRRYVTLASAGSNGSVPGRRRPS